MSAPCIEARSLTKRFGQRAALRNLDLRIESGQFVALLGANGAGKTTLLRLIAGLASPSAGAVEIGGQSAQRPAARRRIGYLGHATLLYPQLSARENLVFTGRLHGVADPEARAREALEAVGLAALADVPVGGFSRGMAQRVAIARCRVHDPEILLLDEPFSGLDRSSARRLETDLAALRSAGRTLVLVTHDPTGAARRADRTLILAGGRLAQEFGADASLEAIERASATLGDGAR